MSPTRRNVLTGGVVLFGGAVLSGCGGHHPIRGSTPRTSQSTAGGPPPPAFGGAIKAEQNLLGTYAQVLARHPQLAAVVALPISHHRAHAIAMGGAPASARSAVSVPADPRAAVELLVTLERATAQQREKEAVSDIEHGSLLAAIAAAEAVHVDVLTAAVPAITSTAPKSVPGQ